jgi:hypothetical protein
MAAPEIADRPLKSLGPTRGSLTRSLAEIPIGGLECRRIDHVVQELDRSAAVLTAL